MNQRGIKGVGFLESNFFSSSPTPARTATPPAGCGRGGRRRGRRRPGWQRRPAGLGSRVSGVGVGGGLHDRRAVEGWPWAAAGSAEEADCGRRGRRRWRRRPGGNGQPVGRVGGGGERWRRTGRKRRGWVRAAVLAGGDASEGEVGGRAGAPVQIWPERKRRKGRGKGRGREGGPRRRRRRRRLGGGRRRGRGGARSRVGRRRRETEGSGGDGGRREAEGGLHITLSGDPSPRRSLLSCFVKAQLLLTGLGSVHVGCY